MTNFLLFYRYVTSILFELNTEDKSSFIFMKQYLHFLLIERLRYMQLARVLGKFTHL